MTKVKNITSGPKIVNAMPAIVLQAGEERDDLEFTEGELKAAIGSEWFEIDGKSTVKVLEVDLQALGIAELLQLGETEGLIPSVEELRQRLISEIEDKRAEGKDPLDHDGDGEKGGSASPPGEPATADEIKAALAQLDGKNDAQWTGGDLPKVETVAELTGKTVTRKAIEEAAPDFKRPTT